MKTETLPRWDLSDYFSALDGKDVKAALKKAADDADAFASAYRGKLAGLDGAAFGKALEAYEQLQMQQARLGSYAQMQHSLASDDSEIGRHVQTIGEALSEIGTKLIFVTLELATIDDAVLAMQLKDSTAARYAPWLRDLRIYRDHLLPEDQERLMHELDISGRSAWVRLYDNLTAGLTYEVDGEALTEAEVRALAEDPIRSKRERAAKAIEKTVHGNIKIFAHIHNTLAKDGEISDRWRKYNAPDQSQHLANLIEPEVVEALRRAVKDAYPRLSHRYFALKAKWLNLSKLKPWDVRAPLPEVPPAEVSWAEAQAMVEKAYSKFDPRIGAIASDFFNKNWIDAEPRAGKYAGAYSMPTVPGWHPYIFMNFMGKAGDVATLAHELGHGVHQVLADKQGYLVSSTPLTLAETASVFGEMLTFRDLLAAETNIARKKAMLADKVEDSIGTMIRQIAYDDFEQQLHNRRKQGEMTPDEIDALWVETQQAAFGPAVEFSDVSRHNWALIPHFIHTPFYVYAYAFGECLVNALYMTYTQQPAGFADKYYELLSSGGKYRHKELLAPFGLDASDPAFWQRGLKLVEGLIDELEALDAA